MQCGARVPLAERTGIAARIQHRLLGWLEGNSRGLSGHPASAANPYSRGNAFVASECGREVARAAKPAAPTDLGQRQLTLTEQAPCAGKAASDHLLVRGLPDSGLERAKEVILRKMHQPGQLPETQPSVEVRLHVIEQGPQRRPHQRDGP